MQGNIRPLALANGQGCRSVSAHVDRGAHGARQHGRDTVVSSRSRTVRARGRLGHVDAFTAVRCKSARFGRGFVYFGGIVSADMLIWACVASFLIGCLLAFVVTYGEATLAYVRMYG